MKKKYIEALQMQVNKTNSSSAVKAAPEKSASRGFTLVELVVVIAVLGILAGIAIPRFMKSSEAARGARILGDLRTVDSAIMVYQARNGSLPADGSAGIDQLLAASGSGTSYLAAWPTPPSGNFSVVQNNGATGEHESNSLAYEIKNGRAVYTSGDITNGTVEDYLIGDPLVAMLSAIREWQTAQGDSNNGKGYRNPYANMQLSFRDSNLMQTLNVDGIRQLLGSNVDLGDITTLYLKSATAVLKDGSIADIQLLTSNGAIGDTASVYSYPTAAIIVNGTIYANISADNQLQASRLFGSGTGTEVSLTSTNGTSIKIQNVAQAIQYLNDYSSNTVTHTWKDNAEALDWFTGALATTGYTKLN